MEWARKAYSAAQQSRHLVLFSSLGIYRRLHRLGRGSACGKRPQMRAIGDLAGEGMGERRGRAEEGCLGVGNGRGPDW
jgi:hypothetical protein